MVQDIYIIDDKEELIEKLNSNFKTELSEFKFKRARTQDIEIALKSIPSLIIIDEDHIDIDVLNLCKSIRSNEDNGITPIIVISSNTDNNHIIDVLKSDVEYYINKPFNEEYLYYIIKNIVNLLIRNRRVSPLTGLPGNVQIQAEIKKRLLSKELFGIFYFDLDNFKAYNDVYGFANGDEIIKFTARTISQYIHQVENSDNFIGHIGGDDFIAIISPSDYDKVCQNIIAEFDKNVVEYYNSDDVERGYVEVANRRGIIEQFPLTTISIAVLEVNPKIYKSALEIGEVAGQIKCKAKTMLGSTYIINRRRF